MKRIASVGSLLKRSYRIYSNDLLSSLQDKGFIDLRPSFLEILTYVCETNSPSIKEVGQACGLKKQTMTSHLNELELRGYISRISSEKDKREFKVELTEYGEKFKVVMLEVISKLEEDYLLSLSDVELDRVLYILENFHKKIQKQEDQQTLI